MRGSSTSPDRGGNWVAAQFALLAVTVAAAFVPPGWGDARVVTAPVGAAVGVLGAALFVWTARTLGPALTPFPEPSGRGRLVEAGPYAYVRHPMYSAGLLFCAGYALATSPAVFLPLVALAALWHAKANVEEARLRARYDGYAEYADRVRGRFAPLG